MATMMHATNGAYRITARARIRHRPTRFFSSHGEGGGILHHEWITGGKITKERPERSGDGTQQQGTVVFLHGLLGSGKNLRMPAKRLTQAHPHLTALMLDLRGHGTTSALNTLGIEKDNRVVHTLQSCADDVIHTVKRLGLVGPVESPVGVVGHSFGGRTALQYVHSLLHPDDGSSTFDSVYHPEDDDVVHPPHATFILDAVPGQAHGSVARVVDSVSTVPMPICSKKELVSQLVGTYGLDEPTALWMTTNLVKSPCGTPDGGDGFVWTFDLNIIRQILEDFPQQDFMELTRDVGARYVNHPNGIGSAGRKSRLSVVMAGKNEAWTSSIVEEMEMTLRERSLPSHDPFLTMHTLPDAGHNVHVDDLEGLMRLLEEGFR